MAKITDEMLVVDLEATCWDTTPPQGQYPEIIEIGVCRLSRKNRENQWKVEQAEGIIVKPEHSKISKFCTDLTTITQAMVDKGISFFEACKKLENDYNSRLMAWASWGDFDRKMFEKQCPGVVRYPFGDTHYNVKSLYSLLRKIDKEMGMAEALRLEGIVLEGTHHRGVDDATNTARILQQVFNEWKDFGKK